MEHKKWEVNFRNLDPFALVLVVGHPDFFAPWSASPLPVISIHPLPPFRRMKKYQMVVRKKMENIRIKIEDSPRLCIFLTSKDTSGDEGFYFEKVSPRLSLWTAP